MDAEIAAFRGLAVLLPHSAGLSEMRTYGTIRMAKSYTEELADWVSKRKAQRPRQDKNIVAFWP
jgi:hypothetical protein